MPDTLTACADQIHRTRATSAAAEYSVERRVLAVCVTLITLVACSTLPLYARFGLTIAWQTALPQVTVLAALIGLRAYYAQRPGPEAERSKADMVLVVACVLALTNLASPAQYLAVALKRPLIDPWLAAADAALGVHVPTLAAWTQAHPRVSSVLTVAYQSLLPQFVAVPIILGLMFRDRRRLWEYCFHFCVCAVCTVAALALFPAECAFLYYGFDSTLPQARFIAHFTGVRAGMFTLIDFRDLEGLVSMPSFHVAGALMATWAVRDHAKTLSAFAVLNALLIAATFMSGAHYVIDVIATVALFALSVFAYRCLTGRMSEELPTNGAISRTRVDAARWSTRSPVPVPPGGRVAVPMRLGPAARSDAWPQPD